MKEFKGTKGKWEKAGSAVVVNGVQIADVYCYGDLEYNRHEAVANAQLIATAPELLDALQKAICYVPIDEEDFDDFARVINKALGKDNK